MNDHAAFVSQRHFGSLDGLRAISIIAVIWHHTLPMGIPNQLARMGAHGVTLFFAISGFLITTLLLRERQRTHTIDLKAFYVRRSLRIFPLYYGVLLLYVAVVVMMERNTPAGHAFFDNLIYFATYTSNLFVGLDGRVIFYFAWSLAAEEQFYLIWPALLLLMRTPRNATLLLCAVLVLCITGQLLLISGFFLVPLAIVSGALLALTLNSKTGFAFAQTLLGHRSSVLVIMAAWVAALAAPGVPSFMVHLLSSALVGACVIREDHPAAPIFSWKPIAYIGSISYGMYMFHMLCKNAVGQVFSAVQYAPVSIEVFVATVGLSVLVATLSFTYYESIFLRMKRRFER